MLLQELCDNVWTKSKRYSTVVFIPARDILVGIRPKEVTQQPYQLLL